jgi:hypothetical protein
LKHTRIWNWTKSPIPVLMVEYTLTHSPMRFKMVSLSSGGQACCRDFAHPGNWHRLWLTVLFQFHLLLLTILKHTAEIECSGVEPLVSHPLHTRCPFQSGQCISIWSHSLKWVILSFCSRRSFHSCCRYAVGRRSSCWKSVHSVATHCCIFNDRACTCLDWFEPLTPRDGATGLAGLIITILKYTVQHAPKRS